MPEADLQLLILDVDGVLTDGTVLMTATGEARKAFYVQDGCAIKLWQRCGGTVAILSGRSDAAVGLRAKELGIGHVQTGAKDKRTNYEAILAQTSNTDDTTIYIGDDLPDLGPMARCGFPVAVANAAPAVKRAATYVTRRRGGEGAVAEVVELLLRKKRLWSGELLAGA